MSKTPPAKRTHHKRHKKVVPQTQDSWFIRHRNILLLVFTFILVAVPFGLGKYCEFNSPDAYDSGGYVYSAKHILDGAKIGVEEKPSAQVGTLLINMLGVKLLGFNETGPKLIQMFLQAAALFVMFVAMTRLFGVLPAIIGVVIASVYLSAPIISKAGNVKEQHMIAFMILGMSCFVLYKLNHKLWYAIIAGAFLSWAPLFKETGYSVIGAVGLFVIAQPLLKHISWKKTGTDILLMLAGMAIVISPVYLWLIAAKAPINYFPYSSVLGPIAAVFGGSGDQPQQPATTPESSAEQKNAQSDSKKQGFIMRILPDYVSDSWQIMTAEQRKQARARVFRWYGVLILPISLALASIILKIWRMISYKIKRQAGDVQAGYEKFVLLFAVWWFLDMALLWVSPRSYEQYYLPLNASAAILSGYFIAAYDYKLKTATSKPIWILAGIVGIFIMIVMSWHIFFGVGSSPHSGIIYTRNDIPEKRNGYVQRLRSAYRHSKGGRVAWESAGEYIQAKSEPDDGIYVWGWFPGIYVAAQRMSPAPKAMEGTMHTLSPQALSERIDELLTAFKKQPPKFLVDTHKQHFPWDRPPLELWPWDNDNKQFVSLDNDEIEKYDKKYTNLLRMNVDPEEVLRYEAMKPFRDYVMNNYKIVQVFGGQHVVFQRK